MRAVRPAERKGKADACHRAEEKQGILSHVASLMVDPASLNPGQLATLFVVRSRPALCPVKTGV
jgi:hypothetical protein